MTTLLRKIRVLIAEHKNEEAIVLMQTNKIEQDKDLLNAILTMACIHENIEMTEYCLSKHANPDSFYDHPKMRLEYGQVSNLGIAAIVGNVPLIELLLSHNADINKLNEKGISILEHALNGKSSQRSMIIDVLLAHGANMDARMSFNNGQTFYEALTQWNSSLLEVANKYRN